MDSTKYRQSQPLQGNDQLVYERCRDFLKERGAGAFLKMLELLEDTPSPLVSKEWFFVLAGIAYRDYTNILFGKM